MLLLGLEWWRYLLSPAPETNWVSAWPLVNWFSAVRCRWRNHPEGVFWYNPGEYEPDMRCKGCGEDLG